DGDDFELPEPKRPRRSVSGDATEVVLPNNSRPLPASSPSSKPSGSRTSKYLFSSSAQRENEDDAVNGDADGQRKRRLHEEFVKKLGKPDSIADIKRRNRALVEDDVAEGPDEEEDEEAAKPAPNGRKGVATKKTATKLTP